jgi:hypothetical protein
MIDIIRLKYPKVVRINNDDDETGTYIMGCSEEKMNMLKEFLKEWSVIKDDTIEKTKRGEFIKLFSFSVDNLVAYGTAHRIKRNHSNFMGKLISNCTVYRSPANKSSLAYKTEKIMSYRCCVKGGIVEEYHNDPSTGGLIIHEDVKSAISCILEVLKFPTFIIIIKI